MKVKYLLFKVFTSIIFFIFMFVQISCNNDEQKNNIDDEQIEVESFDEKEKISQSKTKQIFHTLPSPIETALIIKHSGAIYETSLLNPVDNLARYTTNKSMALNLGIYTTDLSYASMFDQSQTSLDYMTVAKKLAEKLGILEMIDEPTMRRLEQNLNNKDIIMSIISESLLNSNASLMQNERPAILSMVVTGGWIEGLYLATQLVNVDKVDIVENDLVDRVIDQRLTINNVVSLLEVYKDYEAIAPILADVKELKASFDKIKVEQSKEKAVLDTTKKVAMIKTNQQVSITPEVLKNLAKKVESIRNKYVF